MLKILQIIALIVICVLIGVFIGKQAAIPCEWVSLIVDCYERQCK